MSNRAWMGLAFAPVVFVVACGAEGPDDHGITVREGAVESVAEQAQALSGASACEGNNFANDNYADNVSMGGPVVGIEWLPTSSVTVSRIEVFTGEVVAPNQLAIWSDDGGSPSQPLAVLGYTQPFTTTIANGWRGGNLIAPVSVTAGTKYWMVWDPTGGEQSSQTSDPLDVQQTYWGSYSGSVTGGTSWFGPFSFSQDRWKFRMFCGTCTTVSRGSFGLVSDASITSLFPNANLGSSPSLQTSLGPATRQGLLSFDLGFIPSGSTVSLAQAHLVSKSPVANTVDVHAVTAPWTEAAVTWNSFGAAYAAAPAATITNPAGPSQPVTADLTALADSWAQGLTANNGVVLKATTGLDAYRSSESVTLAERPALDICYSAPPGSCKLGNPYAGALCGSAATPCNLLLDESVSATPAFRNDSPAVAIDEKCNPHIVFSVAQSGYFGYYGQRVGPGTWNVSSTPFALATDGLEAKGGADLYGVAYDGAYNISMSIYSGGAWSSNVPFGSPCSMNNMGVARSTLGDIVVGCGYNQTSQLRYGIFSGGSWAVTTLPDSTFWVPALELSPANDVHLGFWAFGPGSYDVRWRTPTSSAEVAVTVPYSSFTSYEIGTAVTNLTASNPEGVPHFFVVKRSGGFDQLHYATRTGPGAWSTVVADQVPSTDPCPYYPTYAGETCTSDYWSMRPLHAVSTPSGSVRMLHNAIHWNVSRIGSCDPFDPSYCYWSTLSSTAAGEIRMAAVDPAQPIVTSVVASGVETGGEAKLDGTGKIHVALYDATANPTGNPVVRYLQLGP